MLIQRIYTSFKCSKCDFVALDKTGLEKHTRDLHVYKCTHCSYFGTCQNNLDIHIRDDHSYMCHECGHNFNTNDDLSKHSMIHLSHCTKCPYTCQNRQTMHKHMRSAHPAMWNCEFCNYETKSVNDLSYHEKVVHSGQLFSCSRCDISFTDMNSLNSHMTKHDQERRVFSYSERKTKGFCSFWNNGNCRFGESCMYLHENAPFCRFQSDCRRVNCCFFMNLHPGVLF